MKIETAAISELVERMLEAQEATAAPEAAPSDLTPLEARVAETAQRAIDGQFASAADLRAEVVQLMVEERFGAGLDTNQRSKLVENLNAALVDDPEFGREVDEMLIHAARQLARSA